MKVKIYKLLDPRDSAIRYIGRTSKENLNNRLCEHVSKAKYHLKYGRRATHLVNWIKELLVLNLKPIIVQFEEVIGWEASHVRERELIAHYKTFCNLTNLEDKGMGNHNHFVSDDVKIKISNTLKAKYADGMVNYGGLTTKKTVYQFDMKGNFIKEYESVASASKELDICKVAISGNCSTNNIKNKSADGYIFSYTRELSNDYLINRNFTKVKIKNITTNDIYSFKSLAECSRNLHIPNSCLRRLIKDTNKIYKKTYKIWT